MAKLKYRCPKAFWKLVYAQGVPHTRLNARVIRFSTTSLDAWIDSRSSAV